jgi:hypothetical protein
MTMLLVTCPVCHELARFPIGDTAPAVERAVAELARTAKDHKLSPAADALGTMAIDLARAFDICSDDRAMAAMAKELRATLDLLEQRAGRDDNTGDALADRLSSPVAYTPPPEPANAGPQDRRSSRTAGPADDALATSGRGGSRGTRP